MGSHLQIHTMFLTSPFFPKPYLHHHHHAAANNRRRQGLIPPKSFMDLVPQLKPAPIEVDIEPHDSSGSHLYDAAIIGCGPSGLHLAEQASARGLSVCCIDPSPLSHWPNNYGVWVDEFSTMGLADCLHKTWPTSSVFIDDRTTKHLHRPYGRICRRSLKTRLLQGCLGRRVRFHRARALDVDHDRTKSIVACSDGSEVAASFVVDATGLSTPFVEYDEDLTPSRGYQMVLGILAEVEGHPFHPNEMLLMDWRDSHLDPHPRLKASNRKVPTFSYAMPIDSSLVFIEETVLLCRPMITFAEIERRMAARLRHLGVTVKRVLEDEIGVLPMGGSIPRLSQRTVAIGGAAGMAHPATGYTLARALAVAPAMADMMAECLGSVGPAGGARRVWGSVWTVERAWAREFDVFGMEMLLSLDIEGTRRFFDAFFRVDPYYQKGFFSSRLSAREMAAMGVQLFGEASDLCRMDMITKCPFPFATMMSKLALHRF